MAENKESMNEAPVQFTKPEFAQKDFLPRKRVKLLPVQGDGQWATILDKDIKKEPYMFNKVKRTYTCPVKSNGDLAQVLDNREKFLTPQYPTEPLTEREFFEKELGRDLNHLSKQNNFWMLDSGESISRVVVTREGRDFDLSKVSDAIQYKICKANSHLIASSYEGRNERGSYEFMLVDTHQQELSNLENSKLRRKGFKLLDKYTQSQEKMKNFLKVAGKGYNETASPEWLENEVTKIMDVDLNEFIKIAEDPSFDIKTKITDGVRIGAIEKKGFDQYAISGRNVGNISDLVSFLNDTKNQDELLLLESRINNAKQ